MSCHTIITGHNRYTVSAEPGRGIIIEHAVIDDAGNAQPHSRASLMVAVDAVEDVAAALRRIGG